MKQRKMNISPWLLMGLATVLVLGCLMTAVGTSYARYQTDAQLEYTFQPEAQGYIVLGVVETETSDPTEETEETEETTEAVPASFVCRENTWEYTDGQMQLSFAVSNGTDEETFATVDQQVSVRVIASAECWSEETENVLTLTYTQEETVYTYTAVATAIVPGTTLYETFGEGWILTFLDDRGREPDLRLSGESWNWLELQLDFSGSVDAALLQLQVTGQT